MANIQTSRSGIRFVDHNGWTIVFDSDRVLWVSYDVKNRRPIRKDTLADAMAAVDASR